jgi:adenylate cyclase
MADLIAQGTIRHHRWRRRLVPDETKTIGRTTADWLVPWDDRISRQHVGVQWDGEQLDVSINPQATNPVFFAGESPSRFRLRPGEYFVIGETRFILTNERAHVSVDLPNPARTQTFTAAYLRSANFRRAEQQIVALSRLPELIAGAATDQELLIQLVNLLLSGISNASAVAVLRVASQAIEPPIELLHWDRSKTGSQEFQPSQRLILEANRQQQGVVHIWNRAEKPSGAYTQNGDFDWAFCLPIHSPSRSGWCIYVAGNCGWERAVSPDELCDELKFAEIVAATVGNIYEVRALQRRQAALARFFSAPVLQAVAAADIDTVLAPRETEACVLFCDLRGFSRQSEQSAHDLMDLLQRVSSALGVATRHILDHGGVIGDFHGDAAMGFWGWPLQDLDMVHRAVQAASDIRAAFSAASRSQNALTSFRIGMGIATGKAVAGRIGTADQQKVTVFGPVVNVSSRLEGLNTTLGTEILIDDATARRLRSSEIATRIRYIARIRPYGMSADQDVYQLLSADELERMGSDHLDQYARALAAFLRGDWTTARKLLSGCLGGDGPAQFLLGHVERYQGFPPADFKGAIRFDKKS